MLRNKLGFVRRQQDHLLPIHGEDDIQDFAPLDNLPALVKIYGYQHIFYLFSRSTQASGTQLPEVAVLG